MAGYFGFQEDDMKSETIKSKEKVKHALTAIEPFGIIGTKETAIVERALELENVAVQMQTFTRRDNSQRVTFTITIEGKYE